MEYFKFYRWLHTILVANNIELEKMTPHGYEELSLPEALDILRVLAGSLAGRFISYDEFYGKKQKTHGVETLDLGVKKIFRTNDYIGFKQLADMNLARWKNGR